MTMLLPKQNHVLRIRITTECQRRSAEGGVAVPEVIEYEVEPTQFRRLLRLGAEIGPDGSIQLDAAGYLARTCKWQGGEFKPSTFNAKQAIEFAERDYRTFLDLRRDWRPPLSPADISAFWPRLADFALEAIPADAEEAIMALEAIAKMIAEARAEIAASCCHLGSSEEKGPHLSAEPCLKCSLYYVDDED